jgi:acyl phosphate:glycerol-3-phosphate acyltransferase
VILSLFFGYLCGSIPFGLLITRLAGTSDIRSIGSGNIGATNVLRTGRKDLAAATLVCDGLKGTVAVLLAARFGGEYGLWAALGAVLGHIFPVWLNFRGGKGVATFLGTLLGGAWPAALGFALIWLGVAAFSRYSSVAALAASAATPWILYAMGAPQAAVLYLILALLLWYKHRENITRLLAGEESRIGEKT